MYSMNNTFSYTFSLLLLTVSQTHSINDNSNTRHLLEWEYQDLLGNSYTQKVYFNFKDGDLENCENDTPVFIGKTKYVLNKEGYHN